MPVPLPPELIVSQESLAVAVQAQSAAPVTVIVLVDVVAATFALVGDAETVQLEAALCVTLTLTPAIVSVPVRGEVVKFGSTCTIAVPLPAPDWPDENVIHDAFEEDAHVHPRPELTLNESAPPAAGIVAVVGLTV